MTARTHDVRRLSIRVAFTATALVAAAYFVVAVAVVGIVTRNLTAQIDSRLADAVRHIPPELGSEIGHFEPPPSDRPFGPILLVWTVKADGTVVSNPSHPELPVAYRQVTGPQTANIGGTEVRILGARRGTDYVVIAQTLDSVAESQSTLIVAELVIGPVLLAVVFLGAVARRVAMPIELARRRQFEFTADASHELRTPLAVIEANTSLALAQDRSESWYRTAFQRVDLEAKRMRRLVDDLLWLARFDAAAGPPNAEPVDLGVLAAQAADRFAVIAEARHLGLEVQAPRESLVVAAPAEWLDRLLGVLLDNACKYSPDGGIVRVVAGSEGGRISVSVDDSGPGIPEAERSRIFDRFHRASETQGGAGLGLAIADAIVRATNGQWRIGTAPTGGARMSVSWPRAFSGPREAAPSKSAPRTLPSD